MKDVEGLNLFIPKRAHLLSRDQNAVHHMLQAQITCKFEINLRLQALVVINEVVYISKASQVKSNCTAIYEMRKVRLP